MSLLSQSFNAGFFSASKIQVWLLLSVHRIYVYMYVWIDMLLILLLLLYMVRSCTLCGCFVVIIGGHFSFLSRLWPTERPRE